MDDSGASGYTHGEEGSHGRRLSPATATAPMDQEYLVNNGPSSTTPSPPASDPAPLATGLVAVLSKDLFFGMRIRTSLRQLGYSVAIAQDAATFSRHLEQGDQRACLGIVDFNFPVDWEH